MNISLLVFYLTFIFSTLIGTEFVTHDDFLINTIPKSGTHFLHKTITTLTGKSIKSVTGAPTPSQIQEAKDNNSILRIFAPYQRKALDPIRKANYKMVMIYRDPRDALISLIFYMRDLKGIKRDFFRVVPNFDELSFDDQLLSVIQSQDLQENYLRFYSARIQWLRETFVYGVRYENLVGSKGGGNDALQMQEILNIAEHINLTISFERAQEVAESIYRCIAGKKEVDGKTFTHGQIGSWKYFMNEEHKCIFKEQLGQVLIQLGYEKDNNW